MNRLDDELRQKLVEAALHVRQWAYAPYSNYPVGAALLSASGKMYDGVNVESVAFPTTICAERVAIFKAVSEGEREFSAMAVVTRNGGAPCGACRQVMAEFGLDWIVLIANEQGEVVRETTLRELLPDAFTPQDLK